MHFWLMAPLAILVLVAVDLSSERFDPVFETIPAAVGTALFTMAALAVLVATFFATYSFPAEVESRVAYTVTTKPVGRIELVAGKVLGTSLLLLGMLAVVAAGAYGYFLARASGVRALAAERHAEAVPRARHPADLNALEAMAHLGPLQTYRYRPPDTSPEIRIHHAAGTQEDGGTLWVLGESGASLRWNLARTPLRRWVLLYSAVDQAAAATEALRAALRLGAQAQEAGDMPAAQEAYTAAAQRLEEAAGVWDLVAQLWETWVRQISEQPPPAPAAALYRRTGAAVSKVAETFAELVVNTTPATIGEVASRLPAVVPPPWSGRLVIEAEVRPPPEQPDEPTQLTIQIVPQMPGAQSSDEEKKGYTVTLTQTGSETQTVPLRLPASPPAQGALRLPFNTDVSLEIRAREPGHLAGVRRGTLCLVGPGDETVAVLDGPEMVSEQFRRRTWIYGRSGEPRQVAVFRFADVPAAILGEGDIPVEVGFTLAAWSTTTFETTAQVTFVNPATGESRALKFTPETHHSALVYLDRSFWRGGALEAHLECLTDGDSFGLLGESVQLRLDGGPFLWNFVKAALQVWLFGTVLSAAGVFLSVRLSWFVSAFAAIAVLIVGMLHPFFVQAMLATDSPVWRWIARHLMPWVPNLRAMLPGEAVTWGEVLPLAGLGMAFVWTAVVVLAVIFVGGYLLKTREVAA